MKSRRRRAWCVTQGLKRIWKMGMPRLFRNFLEIKKRIDRRWLVRSCPVSQLFQLLIVHRRNRSFVDRRKPKDSDNINYIVLYAIVIITTCTVSITGKTNDKVDCFLAISMQVMSYRRIIYLFGHSLWSADHNFNLSTKFRHLNL